MWEPADEALECLEALSLDAEGAFAKARRLIGHPDNDVRWQALIAVADWLYPGPDADPESVWQVVLEHGESDDEDMRTGVATVILEHLLEYHFGAYFPPLRERILAGAPQLEHTLQMCGQMSTPDAQWRQVKALLKQEHD